MEAFILACLLSILIMTGFFAMKERNQARRDHQRRTYRLVFPRDLEPDHVISLMTKLTGTLRTSGSRVLGVQTAAFELAGDKRELIYRIRVPWKQLEFILPQIHALVPGVGVIAEKDPPNYDLSYAVEVGLTNTGRTLNIGDHGDLYRSITATIKSLHEGEEVFFQIVATPAIPQHKPVHRASKTTELKWHRLFTGDLASHDEVEDRRKKLDERNFLAVLRVGAKSTTRGNAKQRVAHVMASLGSLEGPSTRFRPSHIISESHAKERLAQASGCVNFPMQLTASELAALVAWPTGNSSMTGVPIVMSRRIETPVSVPRDGLTLGESNFYGQERPVALGFPESLMHFHMLGATGVGKTTALRSMVRQEMKAGHAVVVIESKGDLFRAALNDVPKDRIKDTIVLDPSDTSYPVGLNVLRQGDPATIVGEITRIIELLFPDTHSVWLQELLFHGLHTLIEDPDATIIDLAPMLMPDDDEKDWAAGLIANVRDPQLKSFWKRFYGFPPARREQMIQPVLSRIWIMSRSKLVNILGQSSSSFTMDDVVRDKKILLVNLSGIERGAATFMGTTLLNLAWNSVQRIQSDRQTSLYLDEAHHYMNLPFDIEHMLVEARSHRLGLRLAHQYIGQLPPSTKAAVMNSARTKMVFQTNDTDARELARTLGGTLQEQDITGLAAYEAVARVVTPGNTMSAPFTLSTLPPERPEGTGDEVLRSSRQTFGRDVYGVRDSIIERRRKARTTPAKRRPRLSGDSWGQPL